MGTKTVISLRVKDIISGCVRVGSGPMGGGGRGGLGTVSLALEHLARVIGVGGV